MSLLLSMAKYLIASGAIVGDGIDCFIDFMPETPDDVVVLHEYSGEPLNPFTTIAHRSVQVKVRSDTAESARAKAVNICRYFRASSEDYKIYFTDDVWGQVYIRQPPFKLGQDESDRVTYCFNLGITTNILE